MLSPDMVDATSRSAPDGLVNAPAADATQCRPPMMAPSGAQAIGAPCPGSMLRDASVPPQHGFER
jgi:hypothetical protein